MPPACVTASSVATKVIAGTITSSPRSRPAAISAIRSASRPLDIPTQRATPVSAANASSKRATAGPFTNAPVSISSAKSWRISADNDACVLARSMKGTPTTQA